MLNDRRRQVLQALVDRYISSATPVGSKILVESYDLGCSPATVRNELAILEETGFVFSPHTSAGRVPTDSGYRSFVDGLLAEPATPDEAERDRLRSDLYAHSGEVDELLRETTQLLSSLTDYVAVVLAPTVSLARIRRIDLLSMSPRRALFVLITESGQVLNRSIDLPEDAAPERLADVERALNAALGGKRAAEVRPLREAMSPQRPEEALHARVVDEILDALAEADRDRMRHVGLPSLLAQPEFHDADRVRPVVTTLEDNVAMLDALADVLASREVTVRIGHENRIDALGNVSIVATHYETDGGDGIVGVVGPTRMDYRRAIAAVRAVATGLSGAMERG